MISLYDFFFIAGGTFGALCALLYVAHGFLRMYLDAWNNHRSTWPNMIFENMVHYDKPVRPKDEKVRRVCNILLRLSGYSLIMAIIFMVIKEVIS